MRKTRLTMALTAAIFAAPLIAACGVTGPPAGSTPEPITPGATSIEMTDMGEDETRQWVSSLLSGKPTGHFDEHIVIEGTTLRVILGGSSSCPPKIDSVTMKDTELTVNVESMPADRACTADYALHGFEGKSENLEQVKTAVKVVDSLYAKEDGTPLEIVVVSKQ